MANKSNKPPPAPVKPTAKALVKPMGTVINPNDPDPLLPVDDEENHRFVIQLFDGDCEILYEIDGQTITFHATHVPETAQGQGIGKKLAQFAFDYAIENKLDVIIKCSFLAEYFIKHRSCKKYRAKYSKLRVIGRYPQEIIDPNL